MFIKNPSKSLQDTINRYFDLAETNDIVLKMIDNREVFQINLEDLIANAKAVLEQLFEAFLHLPVTIEYLQDCTDIIFASPNKTRFKIEWSEEAIQQVQERLEKIDFLKHYSYDN
jgi:hypothetical protein